MQAFSWQRAVVKVGSSLIAPDGPEHGCSAQYLLAIAGFISNARAQGKEVIIVSSGSVAAGRASIPVNHTPSIAEKQAMAAIGQTQMMSNWARFFDAPCAQILLTMDDLYDRERYVNIQNTLRELLKHGAIPIVNENDSVAINELKVGDNDNLAAYTALVAGADTCIICTDIDGLYTANPRTDANARLLTVIPEITPQIEKMASGAGTSVGTGGMQTKLQAAKRCAQAGIQTLIVNGRKSEVFTALAENNNPGTLFIPQASLQNARSHWLKHTLRSKGELHIDKGAASALLERGASLLPIGVTKVQGAFVAGDAVTVYYNRVPVAKGLSQYAHTEMSLCLGLNSEQAKEKLGYRISEEVIHRDNLVRLDKEG
ncbi:glutamate 5-kinase [Alteromonas sp. LMIT006]|jgi:glutamate 5-kinase|uniref:glutamate 5-kinase n=1 Tax=Alteromonadaceae TaxID=72275 RepID=UPI0020CA93D8|nr:glutamate 5-kinase [Alteromonas sp. LMIT006]UTP73157.1 glutamate 5-kinase [Alteromonas sp. LMIT006]